MHARTHFSCVALCQCTHYNTYYGLFHYKPTQKAFTVSHFADTYLSGGGVKPGGHTPAAASSWTGPPPSSGACALMAKSASLGGADSRPYPLDNWEAWGMWMEPPV